MKINSILLENFWSHKKSILEFSYTSPVLVYGKVHGKSSSSSNGAGKSSIFEGLLWGLFGKTTKSVQADSVVNSTIGKNCRVSIEGSCESGRFGICRFRKHEEHDNKLFFYINDVDVSCLDSRETQKKIQQTLNIDFDTILISCFFSSHTTSSFCDLSETNQKSIFNKLLNLNVWTEAQSLVSKELSIKRSELSKLDGELLAYNTTKKSLIDDINSYIQQEGSRIKNVKTKLKSKKSATKKLITELKLHTKKINSLIGKGQQYSHASLCKQQQSYADKVKEIDIAIAIKEQEILASKDAFAKLSLGTCDSCGQKLPQYSAASINELNQAMIKSEQDLIDLQASRDSWLQQKRVTFMLIEKLEIDVSNRNDVINKINKLAAVDASVDELIKAYYRTLKAKRDSISKIHSNQVDVKEKIKNANKDIQTLEHCKVATGSRGIKSFYIKTVLPFLNQQLSKYCCIMTQNELSAKLVLNKEKIEVIVKKSGGDGYKSCSAGEARRVDICMLFSIIDLLSSLGKNPNFIVLDEIFDHLDSIGLERVMTLLNSIHHHNLFVVTHNTDLKEFFEEKILVEKKEGTSFVS